MRSNSSWDGCCCWATLAMRACDDDDEDVCGGAKAVLDPAIVGTFRFRYVYERLVVVRNGTGRKIRKKLKNTSNNVIPV